MKNDLIEFIDTLKNQSFDGWSQDQFDGYFTALTSIEEKIKTDVENENVVTLKDLVLGNFTDLDIDRGFQDLISAGKIPDDLKTSKVIMVFKDLPFFYKFWRNLKSENTEIVI